MAGYVAYFSTNWCSEDGDIEKKCGVYPRIRSKSWQFCISIGTYTYCWMRLPLPSVTQRINYIFLLLSIKPVMHWPSYLNDMIRPSTDLGYIGLPNCNCIRHSVELSFVYVHVMFYFHEVNLAINSRSWGGWQWDSTSSNDCTGMRDINNFFNYFYILNKLVKLV